MTYAQQTKYPKIFDCYWGKFSASDKDPSEEIIANRNNFVEEFSIKRQSSLPQYKSKLLGVSGPLCDHQETYYTRDHQHVVVISPYFSDLNQEDIITRFRENGYILYKQLYNANSMSFVKVIPNKATKRKRVESPEY